MPETWIAPKFTDDGFVDGYFVTVDEPHKEIPTTMVDPAGTGDPSKTDAETADAKKKADEDAKKNQEDPRVAAAREEAITERKKRQAAETARDEAAKKLKDIEDADLKAKGDLQKLLDKKEEELETAKKSSAQTLAAYEKRVIHVELKALAVSAGIIDPRDVTLADTKDVKVDGDDVVGAKEAIEALKKDRPHLFKAADSTKDKKDDKDADKTRRAAPNADPDATTKKKSGFDMTPEEIIKANRESDIWKNAGTV